MTHRFTYAGLSDRGRVRKENEDNWVADPEYGLFVVSDGMGGQFAGALAAKIVVETLPPLIKERMKNLKNRKTSAARKLITAALADLSHQVRNQSQGQPGLEGMGATVVLALIRGAHALIAHMGDSRAYLLRRGRLQQLTRDHSIVQLLIDDGKITREEALRHPARGQLTRYVGMTGDALPEARSLDLRRGDRLLLCTDGLTDMVADTKLLSILKKTLVPKTACRHLIAAANAAGGRDNITAVTISFLT